MMTTKRGIFGLIAIVLGIVALLSWVAWSKGGLGWPHIVGMGASVLILALIWFWPSRESMGPPP